MQVIAGDIGGTKTRLGLFEVETAALVKLSEKTYSSADYSALDDIVKKFRGETGEECEYAAFAIAGPVQGRTARTTNLPWHINAGDMERHLRLRRVALLNDVEAVAWGISELADGDMFVLNPGQPDATGNRAVIAAGTGLGMAGLYWDGTRHHPFATEGGHAEFAPANDEQLALSQFLTPILMRVSKERVLSGRGLVNIFAFILNKARSEEPAWLTASRQTGDPAAAIAREAASGSLLPAQAMELFVAVYGSEAGNLALSLMAKGGIYIGGGIAPKIIESLKKPAFMEAFLAKGQMNDLLREMPVKVIMNDRAALFGAARFAVFEAN